MNKNYVLLVCAAVLVVFGMNLNAWATVASPADGAQNFWQVTTITATYDQTTGKLIGQSGTVQFSKVDIDGKKITGSTNMTYAVINQSSVLTSQTTSQDMTYVDEQGQQHVVHTTTTISNNINAGGMLTGGGYDSVSTDTVYDANNARVSSSRTHTYSTGAELRNGQVLFTQMKSDTVLFSKDEGNPLSASADASNANVLGWSTSTINNTYGNYSGGRWNETSSNEVTSTTMKDGTTRNTNITRTSTYDGNGNLTGYSGTGTGSAHVLDSQKGWIDTTFTITEQYQIINGIARRTLYQETETSNTGR